MHLDDDVSLGGFEPSAIDLWNFPSRRLFDCDNCFIFTAGEE
jgi:hypothetical protein